MRAQRYGEFRRTHETQGLGAFRSPKAFPHEAARVWWCCARGVAVVYPNPMDVVKFLSIPRGA